ncbi:uncharacterized protein LAESUDRAFT_718584 [Laetiporus sulphureus 93-53]|uniref:Uncharacterized protein n=1 Tax=Laetiporus sulphureus 93-53 TaxID=1314785 RepID=A0A165ASR6_9APHY|nr:uncharacterized protein LAESUDRAFT_718584 [Laetiporus sulphureus 93-53]KZS99589.1 hypothetical protein LAESUDRAFT_718584 [Laetiporus sulphureus 93-53]
MFIKFTHIEPSMTGIIKSFFILFILVQNSLIIYHTLSIRDQQMPSTTSVVEFEAAHSPNTPVKFLQAMIIQPCFGNIPAQIDVQFTSKNDSGPLTTLAVQVVPLGTHVVKEIYQSYGVVKSSTQGNWTNAAGMNNNYWYRKHVTANEVMSTRGIPQHIQDSELQPWCIYVGVVAHNERVEGSMMIVVNWVVHPSMYALHADGLRRGPKKVTKS